MNRPGEGGSPAPGGIVAALQHRYLGVVRAAVLNEHYLENELRIEHLGRAIELGIPVDPNTLRDPARFAQEAYRRRLDGRRAGRVDDRPHYPMTTVGRVGLDALQAALDALRERGIRGDLLEIGTDRGGAGVFMRAYLSAVDDESTILHVVDAFHDAAESLVDHGPDLNTVRDVFARFDLLDDQVRFVPGGVRAGGRDDRGTDRPREDRPRSRPVAASGAGVRLRPDRSWRSHHGRGPGGGCGSRGRGLP